MDVDILSECGVDLSAFEFVHNYSIVVYSFLSLSSLLKGLLSRDAGHHRRPQIDSRLLVWVQTPDLGAVDIDISQLIRHLNVNDL